MTKDEEILTQYEDDLTYRYSKANTKSKMKRLLGDLCVLSELYSIYPNIDKKLAWDNDRRLIPLIEEYNIPFSKHISDNKDLYSKSFLSVIDDFKNVQFPFYKDYHKKFNRLSNKMTDELISSFLNEFDKSLYKMYKNLEKEGKIFKDGPERNFALIYTLSSLNDNLIFPINNQNNNLYTSSVIVHELGHLFENGLYINTGNSHLINYANRYPFYEVSSRFLEYAYLRYLEKNMIFPKEVNMAIKNYYIDLFIKAYNISLIYKLEDVYIDEHDCVSIEEEYAISWANDLMNRFNLHSLEMFKGDMIDFRESFIYGIGDLFSLMIYDKYESNPTEFLKEYKNILLTYPYTGDISSFEGVGITKEELLKGEKIIKKIRKI